MNEMNIEWADIGTIKPYTNNSKKHSRRQIEKIAKSIQKFGWKQNLVIDSNNVLVVGHGRYEAAKLLNLDSVPCVRADDLTEDEIKAYRIIDNRISSDEYDESLELSEIMDISIDMSEFDIDTFDMGEIETVNSYDRESSERDYFEKTLTFPVEKKQSITNFLKKHHDEIVNKIIEEAEKESNKEG